MSKLDMSVFRKKIPLASLITVLISIVVNTIGFFSDDIYGSMQDIFLLVNGFTIVAVLILLFNLVEAFSYFGMDRLKVMGVTLGFLVAVFFILTDTYLNIFQPIEHFATNVRFRLSAGEIREIETQDGNILHEPNHKAHPAIHIIGIDNKTVDLYEGYPFSWDKYASVLNALEGSNVNSVMFDIFFQDPKDKNDLLRNAMEQNNAVVVDYAWELGRPEDNLLNSEKYKAKLANLNRYRIPDENVVANEYLKGPEWVSFPAPPIETIGAVTKGLGGANVKYSEGGTNYKMPMVFKWKNRLYPSISLVMAARYYSVDITKDIYVELGKSVTIKNIPDKKVSIGVGSEKNDIMVKPNATRSIEIPIDKEGLMDINFIGGAFSYPYTSIAEINETDREFPGAYGKDNPDYFGNQILMVAMYYATGVAKDIHSSPFGNTAGIEHHANALNTILNQNFLYLAPAWVNSIIYLLIGLFMGLIVPRFKLVASLFAAVLLSFLFLVEVFFVFNSFNIIHVFLTPYLEIAITLIAIVAYRALTEEENVKYIRSTFSRFVAKDVVNELLANPENLKLGGDKKEITVFFSDIRGFTTISESLSPEDLVAVLNDYLSTMTEIVIEYKGTVDKYMGDAIMAFWGAPVPEPEHAYYATLCALRQLSALTELQKKWEQIGWPQIDIGIGLNSGDAVVGNMGSSHRMDYTAMGDTINLGSRLEGTTKVYSVRLIASEYSYEMIKDKVIARELDLIRVKGKLEPVRIYEVMGLVNEADFDTYRLKNI